MPSALANSTAFSLGASIDIPEDLLVSEFSIASPHPVTTNDKTNDKTQTHKTFLSIIFSPFELTCILINEPDLDYVSY
ncbi:hypothetical protein D3C81_1934810 [compost metagenome]